MLACCCYLKEDVAEFASLDDVDEEVDRGVDGEAEVRDVNDVLDLPGRDTLTLAGVTVVAHEYLTGEKQ